MFGSVDIRSTATVGRAKDDASNQIAFEWSVRSSKERGDGRSQGRLSSGDAHLG